MKQVKIKNKINYSVISFVFLFVLGIIFIIYPLFKDIMAQSEELLSQKEKLVILELTVSDLEKFQTIYQDLDEILVEIDDLLINPEVPVEFISFLERISAECLVETQISPGVAKETKEYFWPVVNFQIIVKGSSSNFLRFLEKLENSPYLVDIQRLTINKAGEEVSASLSIVVCSR